MWEEVNQVLCRNLETRLPKWQQLKAGERCCWSQLLSWFQTLVSCRVSMQERPGLLLHETNFMHLAWNISVVQVAFKNFFPASVQLSAKLLEIQTSTRARCRNLAWRVHVVVDSATDKLLKMRRFARSPSIKVFRRYRNCMRAISTYVQGATKSLSLACAWGDTEVSYFCSALRTFQPYGLNLIKNLFASASLSAPTWCAFPFLSQHHTQTVPDRMANELSCFSVSKYLQIWCAASLQPFKPQGKKVHGEW